MTTDNNQAESRDFIEQLKEVVSDFRKAAYEFGLRRETDDHAAMMQNQKKIFDVARSIQAENERLKAECEELRKDADNKMQALVEADRIMGHDDPETGWREQWAFLWYAASAKEST